MQFLSEKEISKDVEFFLDEDETFHLKNVLRISKGQIVKVFDGLKKWECEVIGFNNKNAILKPLKEIIENKKPYINLYFPFIEKKFFEEIIRKGSEIGIRCFYPIITDFTQKNFIFDINLKRDRFNEIIKSSVKQSESSFVPYLNDPITIYDLSFDLKKFILMTPHPIDGNLYTISDIFNFVKILNEINVIVGPEGGFSQKEIDLFSKFKDNIIPLKISYNILRVETAAVSGCLSILALKV